MANNFLIVGFDKYGDYMYPHLRCVIEELNQHSKVEYITFRERGAFEPIKITRNLKKNINNIRSFFQIARNTIVDSVLLFNTLKTYNRIIAIDYFAYIIIGLMLMFDSNKKVVLWSHDIIVESNPKSQNFFYRIFSKKVKFFLEKNKKVIIQDVDRLSLLGTTYKFNANRIDTFFLPVSLNKLDENIEKEYISKDKKILRKPLLLQCGLIHPLRTSNRILKMYQNEFDLYDLCFHGYLATEFCEILKDMKRIPRTSSLLVKSENLFQVISSCDIGIIGYDYGIEEKNFFFIKNASGQMIEFLRLAKPIIVVGECTNLNHFVAKENIGVCINDGDGLKEAVNRIIGNYQYYSKNAYQCFNKYYNIKNYINDLYIWLKK